jgi:hypothetical protein
MMRLLALALALTAAAAPATAQVKLGFRAGVSIATLEIHEGEFVRALRYDDRLGLTGAVTAELPLSDVLAFRTELAYTMKGARREGRFDEVIDGIDYDLTANYDYAFDYVELPLLLEVAESTSYVDLALFAGPTLSLNVREKVDGQVRGTIDGVPLTEEQAAMLFGTPADEWVTATDVGATLGVRAVRRRLALEARFTLGLPVVSGGDEGGTRFIDVKNRAFAISVGYTL